MVQRMKVNQLLEARDDFKYTPSFSIKDFSVSEVEPGRFKITSDKSNDEFVRAAFQRFAKLADSTKSTKWTNGDGKKVSWFNFSGPAIILSWQKEMLVKKLSAAIDGAQKEEKNHLSKEHTKARNKEESKERNKLNYKYQKAHKEELYKKYGKDIVERVKVRASSNADDGYQWMLIVDGRVVGAGMTRYQAEGEQILKWAYLKAQKDLEEYDDALVDRYDDKQFALPKLLKLYKDGKLHRLKNIIRRIELKDGVIYPEIESIQKSLKALLK